MGGHAFSYSITGQLQKVQQNGRSSRIAMVDDGTHHRVRSLVPATPLGCGFSDGLRGACHGCTLSAGAKRQADSKSNQAPRSRWLRWQVATGNGWGSCSGLGRQGLFAIWPCAACNHGSRRVETKPRTPALAERGGEWESAARRGRYVFRQGAEKAVLRCRLPRLGTQHSGLDDGVEGRPSAGHSRHVIRGEAPLIGGGRPRRRG